MHVSRHVLIIGVCAPALRRSIMRNLIKSSRHPSAHKYDSECYVFTQTKLQIWVEYCEIQSMLGLSFFYHQCSTTYLNRIHIMRWKRWVSMDSRNLLFVCDINKTTAFKIVQDLLQLEHTLFYSWSHRSEGHYYLMCNCCHRFIYDTCTNTTTLSTFS